jgi:hypothetical protein
MLGLPSASARFERLTAAQRPNYTAIPELLISRDSSMTALRFAAAVVLSLFFLGAAAHAQTVYRKDVPPGDATPTGGSFSIHFPIPYTDAKLEADDPGHSPAIVYMVTGMNSEMIMLTATETLVAGQPPKALSDLVDIMKQRPGGTVADVKDENKDGKETLSFSARDDKRSYYFRYVSAGEALYSQVIEFPEYERPEAAAMKNDFFNSFRIIKP